MTFNVGEEARDQFWEEDQCAGLKAEPCCCAEGIRVESLVWSAWAGYMSG